MRAGLVRQAVLSAVEMALAVGVPTKTHVLNLLRRLVDGKVAGGLPLDTPQVLILRCEPRVRQSGWLGSRMERLRSPARYRAALIS